MVPTLRKINPKSEKKRNMAMISDSTLPENIPELPPAPPRESLIVTAVKFLQNPKVTSSPLEQKKQFLVKKGLTDEEVEIAISRAGVSADVGSAIVPVSSQHPSAHNVPPQPVSAWTRIHEYSALAIIVGGVVYGLYTLYKRFIEPIFMRNAKVQEEKLQLMQEEVKCIHEELGQNMEEIRTTINELQNQVSAQNLKLSQVAANLTSYKAESSYGNVSNSAIGELKAEITSVKGLLLSRNQFPAQPPMRPVIPSWQLEPSPSGPSTSSVSVQEAETTPKENGMNCEEGGDSSQNDAETENGDKKGDDLYGKTEHLNGFASDDNDVHANTDTAVTSES